MTPTSILAFRGWGRWLFALFVLVTLPAVAETDAGLDAGAASAAPEAGSEDAAAVDPRVHALRERASRIRDLLLEKLSPAIEPRELFDVPLDDENAIRVELERLSAIVARSDLATDPADAAAPAVTKSKVRSTKRVDAGSADASAESGADDLRELDPELWDAHLELDRASLDFYRLSSTRRAALLESHRNRQKRALEEEKSRDRTAAERKAQDAETERTKALEAVKQARSEAARIVADERVRLLGIAKQLADLEVSFVKQRREMDEAEERALGLGRRVKEAIASTATGAVSPAEIDRLYIELRTRLRTARAELSDATSTWASGTSQVPELGDDPLASLAADVDRKGVTELAARVARERTALVEREERLVGERAKSLNREVEALNGHRLSLLPHLSSAKRNAITGFGPEGIDQASSEVRQIAVVLGYHLTATTKWVASLRSASGTRGSSAVTGVILALKAAVPLVLFIWWRRRAPAGLAALATSVRENDKKAGRRGLSAAARAMNLLLRIHAPLAWLALVVAWIWLLPGEAKGLLEVNLVITLFTWTMGGALVVQVVDFFSGEDSERYRRRSRLQTAHIRLRSLRLIGRIVVIFGVILAFTQQLVGNGTIYGWVLSMCWFAAIPVVFVMVAWWRLVIFVRVELKRRKNVVDRWVAANQAGVKSYAAALVGGTLLLGAGAYRSLSGWLGKFAVTRRVLAYLFRRQLDKQAGANSEADLSPLAPELYERLGPGTPSDEQVPNVADAQVEDIIARITAPGGGVFAIVGERGLGKSSVLQRISSASAHFTLVECPFGGMDAFEPACLAALGAGDGQSLEEAATQLDEGAQADSALAIDDAHRLILPRIGGLAAFDRVLDVARRHSKNVAWVFAFDQVIWAFFERVRGARPLFDDVIRLRPWHEEAVARLLEERANGAKLHPSFERLVGPLPSDADDLDREEALERAESNYERLVWDYAGGNPGVALHVFRRSLGVDENGNVQVRMFRAPAPEELELLPDSAVFSLRALIQLERADATSISSATGIPETEVEDALRFGRERGYLVQSNEGYSVHWNWFRAITRFLERRHLLIDNLGTR